MILPATGLGKLWASPIEESSTKKRHGVFLHASSILCECKL
jgi:hypothetical protein